MKKIYLLRYCGDLFITCNLNNFEDVEENEIEELDLDDLEKYNYLQIKKIK